MAPKMIHAGRGRGIGKGKAIGKGKGIGVGAGKAAGKGIAAGKGGGIGAGKGVPPVAAAPVPGMAAGGGPVAAPPPGGPGMLIPIVWWSHFASQDVIAGSLRSATAQLFEYNVEARVLEAAVAAAAPPGIVPVTVRFGTPDAGMLLGGGKGAGKHPFMATPYRFFVNAEVTLTQGDRVRDMGLEIIAGHHVLSMDLS